MKKFWETEGRMIKIFSGIYIITGIFFLLIHSTTDGSWFQFFASIFVTWLFFWFIFFISAIIFGDHYP